MLRSRATRSLGLQPPTSSLTAVRGFRATRPAEIGPLIAGVGVAVAAYSLQLMLKAASNPKFQEAMRDTAEKAQQAAASASSRSAERQSAPSAAASKPASYFTTDVMGVDLGQGAKDWSSACVAVVEDGEARVVPNAQGVRHTPSMVAFQDDGELVGQPAKKLLFSRTAAVVHGHQLLLGLPYASDECAEVAKALPHLDVAAADAADADAAAAIMVHGVAHSPADITARVLRQLKGNAEDALGGRSVLCAVVGVPVDASASLRAALEAAGKRAGLRQLELLAEPVAAATAAEAGELSSELAGAATIGVYSLGGRSFSFSVLRRAAEGSTATAGALQPGWEVVAAESERLLGSEAFDELVVAELVSDFKASEGIDLSSDNLAMGRLHEAAEHAKAELCSSGSSRISLPFITADASGPKHMELTLSRAKWGAVVAPQLQRTLPVCEAALASARVAATDLDAVLLLGGSARAPALQQLVQQLCGGKEPLRLARPEESIALGAAAHARALQAAQYQEA